MHQAARLAVAVLLAWASALQAQGFIEQKKEQKKDAARKPPQTKSAPDISRRDPNRQLTTSQPGKSDIDRTRVAPAIPTTPPSKAEQLQRRMEDERRVERGEQPAGSRNFRCSAYPGCERSSGSYGSCRGVEQVYAAQNARLARQQVARDCATVNNPDTCNCTTQCSRVAHCSNF